MNKPVFLWPNRFPYQALEGEKAENFVASGVDIASIIFAYNLGVHQLGWEFGLGYAALDAWLVIWQRKRITGLLGWVARSASALLAREVMERQMIGRLRWT